MDRPSWAEDPDHSAILQYDACHHGPLTRLFATAICLMLTSHVSLAGPRYEQYHSGILRTHHARVLGDDAGDDQRRQWR
jgi:hypothetical protein